MLLKEFNLTYQSTFAESYLPSYGRKLIVRDIQGRVPLV